MTGALLALALASDAGAKPPTRPGMQGKAYGVLLVADGGGGAWRAELSSLRTAMRGSAVESVDSADGTSIQRALDRLRGQHVGKIVAIPLEPVSETPAMNQIRYLFGVRETPVEDRPDALRENQPLRSLQPEQKSVMTLPNNRGPKRVKSDAELVLTETIDKSPVLAEILADRAAALARRPEKEAVVLVGIAPRSDKALADWKTAAASIAEAVRAKGGFREAAVLYVRSGVRAGQQDKDRDENKAILRALTTQGQVVAVPLAADGRRVAQMMSRQLGAANYRWNGKGIVGHPRLSEWIQATAETASKLPDVRQFRDNSMGGFR
jgi:hypothetical protein